MNSPGNRRFLDGPYARLAALACFVLSAGALAYVHRDDLFASKTAPAAARDDPFSRCFQDGIAAIEKMLSDKSIGAEQAALFRQRAEARCRAQSGGSSGPPGLPPAR